MVQKGDDAFVKPDSLTGRVSGLKTRHAYQVDHVKDGKALIPHGPRHSLSQETREALGFKIRRDWVPLADLQKVEDGVPDDDTFEVGDTVICISDDATTLDIGERYTITAINNVWYTMKTMLSLEGVPGVYPEERFAKVYE